MYLTIGIVTWNTKLLLDELLYSIFKNSSSFSFEVLVVDNASSDGSCEMVKRNYPEVILFGNKHNLGYARAANMILKNGKGKYYLLLNSDTKVKDQSIDMMVKFMEEKQECGLLGPKLLNYNGTLQPSFNHSFFSMRNVIADAMGISQLKMYLMKNEMFLKYVIEKIYHPAVHPHPVAWVGGACLMIRRKACEDVGLMDENFFLFYEEMEWCYRMKKKGWEVFYYPDAEIIHHWSKSIEQVPNIVSLESTKSKLYYFFKQNHGIYFFLIRFLFLIELSLKILIYLCLLPFKKTEREMILREIEILKKSFIMVRDYPHK